MEEKEETTEIQENIPVAAPPKSLLKNKAITIGVPIFIAQLIVVYFITANFLLSKVNENSKSGPAKQDLKTQPKDAALPQESGKFIFAIEDVIVNPAGTDGKRLLLTSLGFDINSEEDKTILQSKEIIIKDAVITTLSGTNLDNLNNFSYRDTLKIILGSRIRQMIPTVKINRVYFSKFILQ